MYGSNTKRLIGNILAKTNHLQSVISTTLELHFRLMLGIIKFLGITTCWKNGNNSNDRFIPLQCFAEHKLLTVRACFQDLHYSNCSLPVGDLPVIPSSTWTSVHLILKFKFFHEQLYTVLNQIANKMRIHDKNVVLVK